MKVRLTGVVLGAEQFTFPSKTGGDPFRFTEVQVFNEHAATLETLRIMSDFQGSMPGKGEVIDVLAEVGTYQGRTNLTLVKAWPEPAPRAVAPARSA